MSFRGLPTSGLAPLVRWALRWIAGVGFLFVGFGVKLATASL
jgi:hypothetical protein